MKIKPIEPIAKIKEYAKEDKEPTGENNEQGETQAKPQERTRQAHEGTGGSLLDEYC